MTDVMTPTTGPRCFPDGTIELAVTLRLTPQGLAALTTAVSGLARSRGTAIDLGEGLAQLLNGGAVASGLPAAIPTPRTAVPASAGSAILQAPQRLAAVLDGAPHGGIGVKEIARRLGVHKTRAYAIVHDAVTDGTLTRVRHGRYRLTATPKAHDEPSAPAPATNRDRVLDAIRAGARTHGEVIDRTGINKGTVSREVGKLLEAGEVAKAWDGALSAAAP